MSPPPRLLPDIPLPPYSYVPGSSHPHPTADPRGHSYGRHPDGASSFSPDRWYASQPFLFGIDLFNHGFYWEAHENWEALWRLRERNSEAERFLKGLIKLAAAGVKLREGVPSGVRSHAQRAKDLFEEMRGENGIYMGLALAKLIHLADQFLESSHTVEIDNASLTRYFWMFPITEV